MVNFISKLLTKSKGKKKTNPRRHIAVDNLYSGKALVYDTKQPYPSYMKKTDKAEPSDLNKGSTIYYDNKDVGKSNAPRPDYKAAVKKDIKKKKKRELGRRTHDAAKKLMGG
jgi:hypothetical protein